MLNLNCDGADTLVILPRLHLAEILQRFIVLMVKAVVTHAIDHLGIDRKCAFRDEGGYHDDTTAYTILYPNIDRVS